MNTAKIRKNFVFSEETNNQLEKLKAVNNQSATKIVQELIAKSYEYIETQERKDSISNFFKGMNVLAPQVAKLYKNQELSIQSINAEIR